MARKKTKTMLDDAPEKTIPAHVPVNADLTSEMLIDVTVNKESDVWVFHDRPFPEVLEWIEYDVDDARLVFVTKGGRINDFGIRIGPLMEKYLQKAEQVDAYLVKDKQIHDYIRVPLVTRRLTH